MGYGGALQQAQTAPVDISKKLLGIDGAGLAILGDPVSVQQLRFDLGQRAGAGDDALRQAA